jgi:hypothetical protein
MATELTDKIVNQGTRDRVIREINKDAAIRAIYRRGLVIVRKETEKLILSRYRLGVLCAEAIEAWKSKGTECWAVVGKLAVAWDLSRTQLYHARAFAEQYSENELKKLMARKMPSGASLSYTHMIALVHVTDVPTRNRLIDLTLNNNLTTDQLAQLVWEILNGGENRATGPYVPSSIAGGLSQVSTLARKLSKSLTEHFQELVLEPLREIRRTTASEALAAQVEKTQSALSALRQDLQRIDSELEHAKQRIRAELGQAVLAPPAAQPLVLIADDSRPAPLTQPPTGETAAGERRRPPRPIVA